MNGYLVSKVEEAVNYGVNERSIQSDIDDIRNYPEADGERVRCINSVLYDCIDKGYCLEQIYKIKFSNSEVLALCKILLDNRISSSFAYSTDTGRGRWHLYRVSRSVWQSYRYVAEKQGTMFAIMP